VLRSARKAYIALNPADLPLDSFPLNEIAAKEQVLMNARSLAMQFMTEEEMQMPSPPIVRIYVQAFSHCAGGSHHYLSCDCTTPEAMGLGDQPLES
jgi:hypothetical protein